MSLQDEVRTQKEEIRRLEAEITNTKLTSDRHEEQISGARGLTKSIETLLSEVQSMRGDFAKSRQGLSKGEKIALLGSGAGFIGAVLAAIAVLTGGP